MWVRSERWGKVFLVFVIEFGGSLLRIIGVMGQGLLWRWQHYYQQIAESVGWEQLFESCRIILFSYMSDSLLHFLYAQVVCSIILNLTFGFFFVRKVLKLDRLAENLEAPIPGIVWLKFAGILILIGLLFLHLILSYASQAYWLNGYSNFSLTVFLFVVNYTMQEYIILKEISRGNQSRYLPNLYFWALCALLQLGEIIAVEMILPSPTVTTILQMFLCIIDFGLLLVSLLFEKRQQTSPEMLSSLRGDGQTSRSIEDSIRHRERIAPPNRLYIDFNKEFQVTEHRDGMTCQYKIAVYVDQNASVITKTDLQFAKLEKEMIKAFPHRPEVHIPLQQRRVANMMRYGQQRQKIYQNYLLEMIRTGSFVTPCLLDFLEVPAPLRARVTCIDRTSHLVQEIHLEESQRSRKPFFKVSLQKGKFILQNTDFLQFIINRPVAEILQLHNRLKEQRRLTIDMLTENPKQQDIVAFFEIVVNKKSLWRSFSAWFRLDVLLQNKVYNYFDPWYFGFHNILTDIVGHEIVFDDDGKIHTCYLLSIKNNHSENGGLHEVNSQSRGVILKKRYSDFCVLDKHLTRFMIKNSISQQIRPILPPKFSPFGSKTSPKSRQIRLGVYMKELMQIQGINHCIKLLEFLQFDAARDVGDTVIWKETQALEMSEQSYFEDLNQKA